MKNIDKTSTPQSAPHVLVVDDDQGVRFTLCEALRRTGCTVEEAKDGVEALAAFERSHPDVILLDIMMPNVDGIVTCTRLRALPGGDRMPILMITALNDEESVNRAFDAGATDYITKPVHLAVLRQRVHRLLRVKQAEDALRESERKYRTLFAESRDAIYITDQAGQFVDVNPFTLDLFGYTREEMLGLKPQEAYAHPADLQTLQQKMEKEGSVKDFEAKLCKKDGTEMDCLITSTARQANDGSILGYQGIIRDVTERKQMQAAALASQKLADLGTLAAGVAHEVNSPLQVIAGVSQSLLKRFDGVANGAGKDWDPDHMHRQFTLIHRNASRCAEIMRSLRTYAHVSTGQPGPNDLNELVHDTLLLIEHQLKSWSNVSVVTDLAEDLPALYCDRNQIVQVLINLLTNARDAMPFGGEITIHTSLDPAQHRFVLRITDTGAGIPEAILSKIFDPFFTTKAVGKGIGLGLSIVSGIVRAHSGAINVNSTPDQGTTVTLFLPQNGNGSPRRVQASAPGERGRFDDIIHPPSRPDERE